MLLFLLRPSETAARRVDGLHDSVAANSFRARTRMSCRFMQFARRWPVKSVVVVFGICAIKIGRSRPIFPAEMAAALRGGRVSEGINRIEHPSQLAALARWRGDNALQPDRPGICKSASSFAIA
jgi:hypothetical protein